MNKIPILAGKKLKWTQPHANKMEYDLSDGAEIIASLHFRNSLGSLATAKTSGDCWTFKRVGFFRTKVTVRPCEGNANIASYKNDTWSCGGTLEFPDGRKYLANTNFWATQFEFKSEAGEPLARFNNVRGLLNQSATVELQEASVALDEMPIIIILGWYLTILMQLDAAATSAVITVS